MYCASLLGDEGADCALRGVCVVRIGVCMVHIGVCMVRIGVCMVHIGVCMVRIGVCMVRIGVCMVRIGVCMMHIGVCMERARCDLCVVCTCASRQARLYRYIVCCCFLPPSSESPV